MGNYFHELFCKYRVLKHRLNVTVQIKNCHSCLVKTVMMMALKLYFSLRCKFASRQLSHVMIGISCYDWNYKHMIGITKDLNLT